MYKRISILMVLLTIVLTVFVSCGFNTDNTIPPVDNNTTKQASDVTIEESDNNSAQQVSEEEIEDDSRLKVRQLVSEEGKEESVFGIWSLDKIVLESEDYSGEYKRGGKIYTKDSFIGYEVEYSPDFFRLGQDIYNNPDYQIWDFNFYDYNNNGAFLKPDLYDLIEAENITVDRSDEFKNINDIPLKYILVWFEKDSYIPVGTQCVMLNEDTMLVGVWGHVILANRVTD